MKLLLTAVLCAALALCADKTGPVKGQGSDKFAQVEATAFLDKASIKEAVGYELDSGIVVIAVKVTPASGQKLNVSRDDFLLRSDRDGQRSKPYEPTQIAGSSVMKISTTYEGGGVTSENRGPAWGGIGGRPSQLPGGSPGIGNAASAEGAAANVETDTSKLKENPVLGALKRKILEEKETETESAGQLYFLMEGKLKVKDIELLYKTPAGRISIRFK